MYYSSLIFAEITNGFLFVFIQILKLQFSAFSSTLFYLMLALSFCVFFNLRLFLSLFAFFCILPSPFLSIQSELPAVSFWKVRKIQPKDKTQSSSPKSAEFEN
jgi:hypothetical protein